MVVVASCHPVIMTLACGKNALSTFGAFRGFTLDQTTVYLFVFSKIMCFRPRGDSVTRTLLYSKVVMFKKQVFICKYS